MELGKDMTFCLGVNCPINTTCKRYKNKVERGEEVWYFTIIPYNNQKKECEMLIPVDIGENK